MRAHRARIKVVLVAIAAALDAQRMLLGRVPKGFGLRCRFRNRSGVWSGHRVGGRYRGEPASGQAKLRSRIDTPSVVALKACRLMASVTTTPEPVAYKVR